MASCFALTCNACANILHSVMNKTWGHVEVLNKRSTQELIVTSQGEKGTQDLHAPLPPLKCVCLEISRPLVVDSWKIISRAQKMA